MKTITRTFVLSSLSLQCLGLCVQAAADRYLDSYEEAVRLFGAAGPEQHIDHNLPERLEPSYGVYRQRRRVDEANPGFYYDVDDKIQGDFSVVFLPEASGHVVRFGFMTALWGETFPLDETCDLMFSVKLTGIAPVLPSWGIQLVDASGKTLRGSIVLPEAGQWGAIVMRLGEMSGEDGFDFGNIRMCEFEPDSRLERGDIKFDFIRFEDSKGKVYGVTDKPLSQRVAEQQASASKRIDLALRKMASSTSSRWSILKAFSLLHLNAELDEANRIVREWTMETGAAESWGLFATPMMLRLYLSFSERQGAFPGRLEPETEKILLETIWARTEHKNDIHWARQSTWYLDGSENHDLNSKACNLVSSYIFMNEEGYKDRIYPDLGFGGGYGYGHAGYYGAGVDPEARHQGGRANLADGNSYKAEDHYRAWLSYFKDYFAERARHGFYVEYHSPVYSKHTMNFVELVYSFSGDPELKKTVGDFLTLYFANWLQASPAGVTGGPKTRHKKIAYANSNGGVVQFLLGGPANIGVWNYWNNVNGFELPPILLHMAFDREGMGRFVYRSRGIGEERPIVPRPKGTERSLVIKPDSRFLKYSYVTPYYVLGTQMDHPLSIYSHLAMADRFHGMNFAEDGSRKICPVALPLEPDVRGEMSTYSFKGMYRSLQYENTLILQRHDNFTSLHPDWFPHYRMRTDQGLYVGDTWDEREEEKGWVFLRKGEVYAGIRVAVQDRRYEEASLKQKNSVQRNFNDPKADATVKLLEASYSWMDAGKCIKLNERFSIMIIQAGDRQEFGDFAAFREAVLGRPILLYKQVVSALGTTLVWTPPGKDKPELVFNGANSEVPTAGGNPVDYEYPMTVDSPYMTSRYGSGVYEIEFDGDKLTLTF